MNDGGQKPVETPPWHRPVRRPERRPTWVMVLAFAMLVFGGQLLLKGASMLTVLRGGESASVEDANLPPVLRDLQTTPRALLMQYPKAVAADAVSKVAFALLLLFSV